MLNQSQIDRCLRFVEEDDVGNYETRMVAEVQLHWIIYQKCCAQDVDFPETSRALQAWQRKWNSLFSESFGSPLLFWLMIVSHCPPDVSNSNRIGRPTSLSISIHGPSFCTPLFLLPIPQIAPNDDG